MICDVLTVIYDFQLAICDVRPMVSEHAWCLVVVRRGWISAAEQKFTGMDLPLCAASSRLAANAKAAKCDEVGEREACQGASLCSMLLLICVLLTRSLVAKNERSVMLDRCYVPIGAITL